MNRPIPMALLAMLVYVLMAMPSWGHLMAAQKGTLRFDNERAYLVISLSVSAFDGLDQDGDGDVTETEFDSYRAEVMAQIQRGVSLQRGGDTITLTDVLLSPDMGHSTALADGHINPNSAESRLVDHVTVLGVFPLASPQGDFALSIELYGSTADEQAYEIHVSHAQSTLRAVRLLTPQFSRAVLTHS